MGFFDNLSKKATETYKNTTDKTNRMAREMKLKSYIGENKNKIERIYTEIGRKVHEKHIEGKTDEIEAYIKPELDEIAQVTRKIENMNTEIRAINNLKLCDNCFAEINLDSKFCPKCGAKQEEKMEPKDTIEEVVSSEKVVPGDVKEENKIEETNVQSTEEKVEEIENQVIEENVIDADSQLVEENTIENVAEPAQENINITPIEENTEENN